MSTPTQKWKWFGSAGHFICGHYCRFHLCTQVGKYLVSTVGEYLPDTPVREITANSRGIVLTERGDAREYEYLKKIGFTKLGATGIYETMVFRAGKPCSTAECSCGMPTAVDWGELEVEQYDKTRDATRGHWRYCRKYGRKP